MRVNAGVYSDGTDLLVHRLSQSTRPVIVGLSELDPRPMDAGQENHQSSFDIWANIRP
jgi:hypothetical protein